MFGRSCSLKLLIMNEEWWNVAVYGGIFFYLPVFLWGRVTEYGDWGVKVPMEMMLINYIIAQTFFYLWRFGTVRIIRY